MEVGERVCVFIPGSVVENVLCLCRRRLATETDWGYGQGGKERGKQQGSGRDGKDDGWDV